LCEVPAIMKRFLCLLIVSAIAISFAFADDSEDESSDVEQGSDASGEATTPPLDGDYFATRYPPYRTSVSSGVEGPAYEADKRRDFNDDETTDSYSEETTDSYSEETTDSYSEETTDSYSEETTDSYSEETATEYETYNWQTDSPFDESTGSS